MLTVLKPEADFSRGCAGRVIGIHFSRPTPAATFSKRREIAV
jgi:hypothetical protein